MPKSRRCSPGAYTLLLAATGFGIVKPASGADWDDIENFSMAGFIAGQTVQLLEDVVALGAAQASFQVQLDSARNALERSWSDPVQRDQAARQLAELLFQKDVMYALLPISEGVSEGWKRSEAFNRLAGSPVDGGISPFAQGAFLHWVQTVRAHLNAYDEALLSPLVSANGALLSSAIEKSQPAYRRYTQIRDAEELSRFLPLPPARLANDGSGLLKEQAIGEFSAVGWGISQRQALGPKLSELARLKQPMLECVYGPLTVDDRQQAHAVYPVHLFWYKSPPANIESLVNMDNSPTLTGFLGGFTGLGSDALLDCPESEKQADALHAANVAKQHVTLAQQEKKNSQQEQIAKKCGSDAACARQEMRSMLREF